LEPTAAPVAIAADAPLVVAGLDPDLQTAWAVAGFRVHAVETVEQLPEQACGLVLGRVSPQLGFALCRAIGSNLQARLNTEGCALLAAVVDLDGCFGFGHGTIQDADAGALAGLIKTAAREWPGLHARVVDRADADPDRIVATCLRPGPVEIGLDQGRIQGIGLQAAALPTTGRPPLQAGEALLISGGARGVTATVARACARAWGCHCVLLGRSAVPEAEPAWMNGIHDEAALKRAIITREGLRQPAQVTARCRQLLANRAILQTCHNIETAGGSASYHQVDIRDADAVAALAAAIRTERPIRGLIHGAGVLADRWLVDVSDDDFDRVYGTKVDGIRHLLAACTTDDLRLAVGFSSSTARFGRSGQVAYAMANEVVNKQLQQLQRKQPDCRCLSVCWGPWDGGMVTSSLKALFAAEGIAVIPLDAGADYLVAEAGRPGPVECVILGAGSRLAEDDPAIARGPDHQNLDTDILGVLQDHVLDGKYVLPLAWQADLACRQATKRQPGCCLIGFENLHLLRGLRLERPEPTSIEYHQDGEQLRLVGGGHPMSALQVHLGEKINPLSLVAKPVGLAALPTGWYEDGRLFHGPRLHLLETVHGDGHQLLARVRISGSLAAALDAVFQLLILWSWQHRQMPCLPTGCKRCEIGTDTWPEQIDLLLRPQEQGAHRLLADANLLDLDGMPLARLHGVEAVSDERLMTVFRAD